MLGRELLAKANEIPELSSIFPYTGGKRLLSMGEALKACLSPSKPRYFFVNPSLNKIPLIKHWLLIIIIPEKNIIFFDPLGNPPLFYTRNSESKAEWLRLSRKKIFWSNTRRPVESSSSTKCGEFCLFFLYNFAVLHASPADILDSLHHPYNLSMNDDVVIKFMRDTF